MNGYPELLRDVNQLSECLSFVRRLTSAFKADPVSNEHGLTYEESEALEHLSYQLEVILLQIKTGEIDRQLEQKTISLREHSEKIQEVMVSKIYQ